MCPVCSVPFHDIPNHLFAFTASRCPSWIVNCVPQTSAYLLTFTHHHRCADLRQKIQTISDTEYATAKADVDRLRQELGQPPLPSLQQTLEEKSAQSVFPPIGRSTHSFPPASVHSSPPRLTRPCFPLIPSKPSDLLPPCHHDTADRGHAD